MALFFIGVPINILSLWLLLQKMFNFGAGRGGGYDNTSRSYTQKLKHFVFRNTATRRQSCSDRYVVCTLFLLTMWIILCFWFWNLLYLSLIYFFHIFRAHFTSSASAINCKRPKQKQKRSMIHSLLLVLCISDLCVIIGLVALFSLPHIWPLFGKKWVHIAPYLIPISQIALLTSEYATVLISLERYVRIVYVCNLRICRFFNEFNFK